MNDPRVGSLPVPLATVVYVVHFSLTNYPAHSTLDFISTRRMEDGLANRHI